MSRREQENLIYPRSRREQENSSLVRSREQQNCTRTSRREQEKFPDGAASPSCVRPTLVRGACNTTTAVDDLALEDRTWNLIDAAWPRG